MSRSQSALEYMMTYGWAILVIVIVAAVLYSMRIFNPSSSTSTSISGFSGLSVTQTACVNSVNNQILELYVSNTLGYEVNITKINITGNNGITLSKNEGSILRAGQSGVFYINGACDAVSSSYSGSAVITYTDPGSVFPGPYFSTGSVSKVPVASNSNLVANFSNSSQIQTPRGYGPQSYLTISFWANLHDLDNINGMYFQISGYNSALSQPCCNWRIAFGTSYFFFDPGLWGDKTAGATANYNKWYLVTMVLYNRSGGQQNLYWMYLNDTIIASGTASPSTSNIGIPAVQYLDFGIGPGSGPSTNGKISDVQVYSANLTSNQINVLYSEGVGGAPISDANLIGWWPLDGNANDYSGNNNNGVTTDVQWVAP